jgi:hypothetical protein
MMVYYPFDYQWSKRVGAPFVYVTTDTYRVFETLCFVEHQMIGIVQKPSNSKKSSSLLQSAGYPQGRSNEFQGKDNV